MPAKYDIIPYGDSGFLVQYQANAYSEAVTDHIHALISKLSRQKKWEELVPGYNSLLAYFCPAEFDPAKAKATLIKALKSVTAPEESDVKTVEIPVCYGGEFGPDITNIRKSSGLSEKQIISLHSAKPYKVCMMGFIPGFSFLSEAPEALHHPRRPTPRLDVPQGSIGIAGWQTGIYGLASPGGWQIIGRTPSKIFDIERSEPFLLKAGDQVKFAPISAREFAARAAHD